MIDCLSNHLYCDVSIISIAFHHLQEFILVADINFGVIVKSLENFDFTGF